VRDSIVSRTLRLPTAIDYVATQCGGMRAGAGTFTLVGRVMNPDGTPARRASYDVRVLRPNVVAPPVSGHTDDQGVFVVCSVELDEVYELSAGYNDWSGSAVRTITERLEVIKIQLKEHR
jgi:hypothetical protein